MEPLYKSYSALKGVSLWAHNVYKPEEQVMPVHPNVARQTLPLEDDHIGSPAQ